MSKPKPKPKPPSTAPDDEMHHFHDAAAMEQFLDQEHKKRDSLIVKLSKKSSGIPSVSSAEAIEVALCFGWIDGSGGRSLDETWYTKRFTPRRAKSMWSEKNVDTVALLEQAGRMRAAGRAEVEAAKADGRWERAYPRPSTIMEPEDFNAKLAVADPATKRFYGGLNRSERYSILWRILTASPSARPGRVDAMMALLSEGKTPNVLGTKRRKKEEEDEKDGKASGGKGKTRPSKVVKGTAGTKAASDKNKSKNSSNAAASSRQAKGKTPSSRSTAAAAEANRTVQPRPGRRLGLRSRSGDGG